MAIQSILTTDTPPMDSHREQLPNFSRKTLVFWMTFRIHVIISKTLTFGVLFYAVSVFLVLFLRLIDETKYFLMKLSHDLLLNLIIHTATKQKIKMERTTEQKKRSH